ncbi:hypothetical protein LINPERPRIM_LOCUS21590 [Linum perenne]
MKLLNGQNMKRNQIMLSFGKTTGSSSSTSSVPAIVNVVGRKRSNNISFMGYNVPKKWVYKFKAQWKQAAIGWHNKDISSNNHKHSYDIHSYSLNFDDGGLFQ